MNIFCACCFRGIHERRAVLSSWHDEGFGNEQQFRTWVKKEHVAVTNVREITACHYIHISVLVGSQVKLKTTSYFKTAERKLLVLKMLEVTGSYLGSTNGNDLTSFSKLNLEVFLYLMALLVMRRRAPIHEKRLQEVLFIKADETISIVGLELWEYSPSSAVEVPNNITKVCFAIHDSCLCK